MSLRGGVDAYRPLRFPTSQDFRQDHGQPGKIADWYIEEHFSYIRVFGCSVPPHALPKFLPDRLVCREVAYQTVTGGSVKN
jgi:hypothetical protein